MTEQHQANQRLRENPAEQYRLLMENVKDFAIFLLDTNGNIATWNTGAERILGYQEAEIIGQPYSIIFLPQDIIKRQPEYELEVARDKGRSEDERWHVRKDGTQFWASGVVTPLWDEEGKLRGYAKVMRDITDRKRAETELAEANRRKVSSWRCWGTSYATRWRRSSTACKSCTWNRRSAPTGNRSSA
jgi:PAS domain S-box-containing protein